MAIFDSHGVKGGVWTGRLRAPQRPARICATCLGEVVAEARLTETAEGMWDIRLDLPGALISDGVASLMLVADEGEAGTPVGPESVRLDRLTIAAGKVLDEDLAAEVALLRSELELLKREFRRMAIAHAG
ncbi:hypothetical protein [Paracoccus salsus]|uniref:hypothetical protein n=1 Tax=Paracoccus salsus TaxID=2911061 RepID=UPI001F3A2B43|nr:hypothetical protein [Paracoccus salsus]MCF3973784.1 hypothetical protein [Paracoccus salsus]